MKSILILIIALTIFTLLTSVLSMPVLAQSCGGTSDVLCSGQSVGNWCASRGGNEYFCTETSSGSGVCTCPIQSVCIPSVCPNPGDYEPDFACILSKSITTPGSSGRVDCCENKCKDDTVSVDAPANLQFFAFNIFNTKVNITYEKIPTIINFVFSTVIAILAVYAAVRGIYIYAIKLPNTTKDEDIAAVSKEARAILIGFILALTFLLITQIIFSVLGLPSLNSINFQVNPDAAVDPDVPTIVIQ